MKDAGGVLSRAGLLETALRVASRHDPEIPVMNLERKEIRIKIILLMAVDITDCGFAGVDPV